MTSYDLLPFAPFTTREWFLVGIFLVTYAALLVVTIQNSRRKMQILRDRLDKARQIQADQQAMSQQSLEANHKRVAELEELIQKLDDENDVLRLELEEKKARLDYNNKVAVIENEKRSKADHIIFSSPVYIRLQDQLDRGESMSNEEQSQLDKVINSVYTGFTSQLYGLYRMTSQEYAVCLLIKARFAPKDIATLTAHSKESVASTRSRLFHKVFQRKGTTKEWDDFVLSL